MGEIFDDLKEALADRYVLERELGAGGMATVFLAHDPRHNRKVAIKVMHPDLALPLRPSDRPPAATACFPPASVPRTPAPTPRC
jgi:hypothetical protein